MPKKKRQVLKELRIDEISGVDVPAQEGARVVLAKRATPEEQPTEEGIEKGAAMTDEVNGHTHIFALHGPPDGVELNAGYTSYNDGHLHPWIRSADGTVMIGAAKGMDGEPHTHRVAVLSKAAEATGEDEGMTDEEKRQLEELTKRAERAERLAKLSDGEKAHLDTLADDTAKDKFLAKSADDRKAELDAIAKAKQDADPVEYTTADGIELRKSAGPALIAMAKSNDALRKQNEDLSKKLEQEALEKRAEAELPNLPGTAAERAALLKSVESITDEDQRKAALAALKAGSNAMSKAFSFSGHGGESPAGTPEAELEKLAKSHNEANPKLTPEQAYDAVLKTAKGKELYTQATAN